MRVISTIYPLEQNFLVGCELDVTLTNALVCVLFLKSIKTGNHWVEIGRTEMIENTHDPSFSKHIDVAYFFEEVSPKPPTTTSTTPTSPPPRPLTPHQVQDIRLELYDVDNAGQALHKQDFIGEYSTNIGHIVGSPDCSITVPLTRADKPGSDRGQITVRTEECANTKGLVRCCLRGSGLDKKDFFGEFCVRSCGWLTSECRQVRPLR